MDDPKDTLQRFYRWNAPIYNLTRWPLLRGREAAVAALELRAGDRVLEIGCGTGLNFRRLADAVGADGGIWGVDLSAHMLRRARKRGHSTFCTAISPPLIRRHATCSHACSGPNDAKSRMSPFSGIYLVQADAARLPLPGPFNAVLAGYALTMVPEWREAIGQACARLAPGGRIVVLDFTAVGPMNSPWLTLLRRYLAWNHVDATRDLTAALTAAVGHVEQLPGAPAHAVLLRGRVKQGA